MQYKIPSQNYARLESEIAKLNRRAEKLGMAPIKLKIVDRITETYPLELELTYTADIIVCEIEGESPQLAGWTLVAVIEPVTDVENIVREVPGQVCPAEFRITDMHCDHCQEVRRRKDVFILQHEDGTYKQVGRNCLADFLGHESPETLVRKAECYIAVGRLIFESQEVGWGNLGKVKSVPTELFLIMVAATIRAHGYVSKSKSEELLQKPTAWIAWDCCLNPEVKHDPVEEQDVDLAKRAIAWAKAIEPDEAPNSYIHDIAVCARQPVVTSRLIGYAASLIPAFRKNEETQFQRRRNTISQRHIGTVGKREIFDLQVVFLKEFETLHGIQTMVKFVDGEGNAVLWRASGRPDWLEVGKLVKVKCTPKEHTVYQDQPETIVLRVSPVEQA